jgi:predicted nucleic acid-binding protein
MDVAIFIAHLGRLGIPSIRLTASETGTDLDTLEQWLRALFAEVVVPEVVLAEVLSGHFPASEAPIQAAMCPSWLRVTSAGGSKPTLPDRDEGEAASIRLALASGPDVLLLIDERAGRAMAHELGLQIAGTASVIGMARVRGLIPSANAVFAELHARDFRIAPEVIETMLERCRE